MSRLQLAAMVVDGTMGAGILALPRTFASAPGLLGALIAGTGLTTEVTFLPCAALPRTAIAGMRTPSRRAVAGRRPPGSRGKGVWLALALGERLRRRDGVEAMQSGHAPLTTANRVTFGDIHPRSRPVRYVYIALIVVFTAVVLLFKVQNFESATVSLFSLSATLPVSLLVIGVYVLGMLTGGTLLALLRGWIAGARARD